MNPTARTINPLRRFQKGTILFHILNLAKIQPSQVYGTWIKKELESYGYSISYGTLYPWLSRLENSGYLTCEEKNVNGKIRKYYSITESGEDHLNKMKDFLKKINQEVMEVKS